MHCIPIIYDGVKLVKAVCILFYEKNYSDKSSSACLLDGPLACVIELIYFYALLKGLAYEIRIFILIETCGRY